MIQINGATFALGFGSSTFLGASGGTPPYSWLVLPDGAGGSIDPLTGLYQAPYTPGVDKIQVTDSLGAKGYRDMNVCTALQLVCDVIRNELNLANDQVYVFDQKIDIPPDNRLYVSVGILNVKPFGNFAALDENGNQVQALNVSGMVSINIMSRNFDALNRKEEVVMALRSFYSEAQQETNSFRIFPLTNNFVNLSDQEGAAILYRFHLDISIQYMVKKTSATPYFDDFSAVQIVTEA